ncbi:hypothetical protein BT67DRAFT_381913 [Trichocladium antarcticum]|uniref:Ras-GAP domain-containing protein n=1 Tax=Trichocladium antarcticum TaxID=1450529 RepID=A0AAN6UIT6_9PEZI|nr:hypothetical protein BT67DRAFT_381913 [Trichocladium antarcticum]
MDARSCPPAGGPRGANAPALPERPAQTAMVLSTVSALSSLRGAERRAAHNLRGPSRHTVRAVTPEPADVARSGLGRAGSTVSQMARGFGPVSPQTSPRSIPAVPSANLPARRQGIVFNDSFSGSFDSASSSPPRPRPISFRPRTHTMDGSFRQQLAPAAEARNRMGSFSSAASLPVADDPRGPAPHHPFESYKPTDLPPQPAAFSLPKDRKPSGVRSRLTKRPSSRPSSPLSSGPPSVDSLPLPIPTADANKVLLLMKNLCGRMRGEVEYQKEAGGQWLAGMCYVEEERGSLMFDPADSGAFHTVLVSDLRGCRVGPVDRSDRTLPCLEVSSHQLGGGLILRPLVAEELDLWLAALLCWQQLRPAGARVTAARPGNAGPAPVRVEMARRVSSPALRETAIIKVGKVMLWDKGAAVSLRSIVRRPSTRDLRSSLTCWKRVSCILHDNGELKIVTENDVTVLSVIELSQLARSAIQQLDRSVLDEDYCLAIFPTYSSSATQLSIFRPVYIALETRVLFEVWFVLLRAFTIPDVYSFDPANGGRVYEVTNLQEQPTGETFRVEKTISVRVTEAKIRSRTWDGGGGSAERHAKGGEPDPITGNYLAEVILDGEVRARTTTKTETKNPFWREDCEFTDLPASMPYLSVLLKRVDGSMDSFTRHLQASLGLAKPSDSTEVLCGSVDIPLHQQASGKDHEQWLQICDDRQQSVGSMLVRVHHEELAVLLQRNYQPLAELLHRFSTGLTAQITDALPGSLRRLAEIFVNIFQVSGHATEWLMNMVEEEMDGIGNQTSLRKPRFSGRLKSNDSIESSVDREQVVRDLGRSLQGEANLLFRGNSLLTQSLEFHMRRLGKEYLSETLADKILEINESDSSCEVDPSKVHHGEDIQQHWNQLIQFTTGIWDSIASSVARLPPELRHILKYIRAVAEDRYGDYLRTVTYTSVSGFIFLRFFCPAILNPKLFGLLRDHPRPRAQRTLTLIAKSLQALANLSTIGKKETWMEPMNKFLTTQRQKFKDFLDAVCAIPAERTKTALPASYSTPITILGRLSPVAREGFPSLPYLVDHGRNYAALVKLWTEAHALSGNSSQAYRGDLLKFHTHCADLQQRASDCLVRIDALRTADTASPPADDHATLSDVMDRITLGDMLNLSAYGGSTSNSTAVWADTDGRPPGSSGSEMDGFGAGPVFGSISISSGRDARLANGSRESSSLRQVSRSSESAPTTHGSSGGTVRSLRNGIHPRKLLSGFIRKTRTASPDSPAVAPMTPLPGITRDLERERDRDLELEKDSGCSKGGRDKNKERADKKARGWSEPRQGETTARQQLQHQPRTS